MLQSVVVLLAAGGLLASGAEPVGALDSAAYDRLLKTHVRPGTVNGIRLNLVDYAAVKADRVYAQGVADFAEAKPELLGTEASTSPSGRTPTTSWPSRP